MSVIEFPTADLPITKSEIDKHHANILSADEAAEKYGMLPEEDQAALTAMLRQIRKDQRDKRHAEAFFDLEAEVCDLERMGQIAQDLIVQCDVGDRALELAFFAAMQLAKMLRDFKDQYYKRLDGEPSDGGAAA
jgi:hypothetical protein